MGDGGYWVGIPISINAHSPAFTHLSTVCGESPTDIAGRGVARSEADRCFIAYAAHELRGEITLQLALAEATLADPDAGAAALREMGEGVVAACERQERLLEALLTLSRSEFAGGIGLGLTIVQSIADAHNTTVAARARVGGGLEIEVRFPEPGTLATKFSGGGKRLSP